MPKQTYSILCMLTSMPKVRCQILLEPEQVAALRRIEARTGAPLSVQIRRAVNMWLKTHGDLPTRRSKGRTR